MDLTWNPRNKHLADFVFISNIKKLAGSGVLHWGFQGPQVQLTPADAVVVPTHMDVGHGMTSREVIQ